MLRAREWHNAEGHCRVCGAALGISGQCSACSFERGFVQFLQGKTRDIATLFDDLDNEDQVVSWWAD